MEPFADRFFRILADPTRLRCLALLEKEGELCVCELTHALGLSQPKVSRHLAQLRESGVVSDRRQGLWVFYQLDSQLPSWAREVLKATVRGLGAGEPFATDRRALKEMANRPGSRCSA